MTGFRAFLITKGGDPDRRVDDDHAALFLFGRRRDLGRSMSSRTAPIRVFSSSIRRRRMRSLSETMTVSVFDLNPSSFCASSINSEGMSSVVRMHIANLDVLIRQ